MSPGAFSVDPVSQCPPAASIGPCGNALAGTQQQRYFAGATCRSKGYPMLSRRMLVLGAMAAGGVALGTLPALAKSSGGPMASLDTDNDGTLDLAEAKKAASVLFDKLDKDHDGTLTKSEIGRRMSAKDF